MSIYIYIYVCVCIYIHICAKKGRQPSEHSEPLKQLRIRKTQLRTARNHFRPARDPQNTAQYRSKPLPASSRSAKHHSVPLETTSGPLSLVRDPSVHLCEWVSIAWMAQAQAGRLGRASVASWASCQISALTRATGPSLGARATSPR